MHSTHVDIAIHNCAQHMFSKQATAEASAEPLHATDVQYKEHLNHILCKRVITSFAKSDSSVLCLTSSYICFLYLPEKVILPNINSDSWLKRWAHNWCIPNIEHEQMHPSEIPHCLKNTQLHHQIILRYISKDNLPQVALKFSRKTWQVSVTD